MKIAMNRQQFIIAGVIGLALYLITTGLSFALFSYFGGGPSSSKAAKSLLVKNPQGHFVIDPSIPRTEPCPLNGQLYTKQERDIWEKRRPLAVMLENHQESRPQSGVSYADIVYEAVAEGGITRLMGVYYCGIAASGIELAPVRSARTYFLNWVSEYDALYNHVGGAGLCNDDTVDDRAKALCQIEQYGIKDMDQFGISFPTCYRNYDRLDHPVATEHTMVCQTEKLYSLAGTRGWTNVDAKGVAWNKNFQAWKLKDDIKLEDRTASFSASFVAWPGYEKDYGVSWVYDRNTNDFKRFNGGVPHTDFDTKQQLVAKVVIVVFAKETGPVDDHGHLLYNNVGSGDALIFQDGKSTKATWSKLNRLARTKFYDTSGAEISLNRGQIWIEMLPIGSKINY